MKCFASLVFTTLFYFSFCAFPEGYPPPDVIEMVKPLHEICTKKIGVTDEEVENYKIEDNSEKMMCYMRCLGVESKWLSEDNTFNVEFILASCPASIIDMVKNVLDKCKDVPAGAHVCEKAYNFHKCTVQVEPERWFLA